MPTHFTRTFRALTADRRDRSTAGILVAVFFVGLWIVWTTTAHVSLYATSVSARIEIERSASEIQSEVDGRIAMTNLAIGHDVHQGDVLAELDAQSQRLDLSRAQALAAGLNARIAALESQRTAEQTARDRDREAGEAQLAEARAAMQRADDSAQFAANEQQRENALRARGFASASDSERAERDARQTRVDVNVRHFTIDRLAREQMTRDADRGVHLQQLESIVRDLQAQQSLGRADVARLENDVARRTIRAPTSGRVADARVLTPGAVVSAGQRLAMIVPAGTLRVVAQYFPAAAGRIQRGQTARVSLNGFPWTQYGIMRARVEQVASEPSDSTLRVELSVVGATPANVPLQHGLPASVEIDVGRLTPARLALRELGGFVSRSATASRAP